MAYANGKLPRRALQMTSGGRSLTKKAAAAYERVNYAFQSQFGTQLVFNSGWTGYRSLDQQQTLFDQLGYPAAAIPGTSNHGYGIAGDFGSGVSTYGSPQHKWMDTVGRRYGWIPLWESKGLARNTFEPWHWVYDESKDEHIPVPKPPVKEIDLYTKRAYLSTGKSHALAKGTWKTIAVTDTGSGTILTAPGEFESQIQMTLDGGTAGSVLQGRFIAVSVGSDGKAVTEVTYPIVETAISTGGSYVSFVQKGTNKDGQRIRFQLKAPEDGVTYTSVQVRTDYS